VKRLVRDGRRKMVRCGRCLASGNSHRLSSYAILIHGREGDHGSILCRFATGSDRGSWARRKLGLETIPHHPKVTYEASCSQILGLELFECNLALGVGLV
jgi:hypothetical protein